MELSDRGSLHYDHAPIVEAAISIEVQHLGESSLPVLSALGDSLSLDFPTKRPRFRSQVAVSVGAQPTAETRNFQDGYVCVAQDERHVLQFWLGGVIASMLAPYTRWEDLEPLATNAWGAFESATGSAIQALGIRFINKIEIPSGEPMEHYLSTYPEVSRKLPQLLNQYFMRLEIPLDRAVAIIQQTFAPAEKSGHVAILFDSDLRVDVRKGDSLASLLEYGHNAKNEVFEASITDRLRDIIK